MTVYGAFLRPSVSPLSYTRCLKVTLDDQPSEVQGLDFLPGYSYLYFALYTTPSEIQPGNHTVTIQVAECNGQTLIIDYVLYTPSFSTLATMPNLSGWSFPRPPTKPNRTGAIVGGVIGGLALVIFGCLLLVWARRRAKTKVGPTAIT